MSRLPQYSDFDPLPDWMEDAACKGAPTDWWFPGVGEGTTRSVHRAKRICRRCQVRVECLDYAISTNQEHGIWGGLAINARKTLKAELQRTGEKMA